MFDHRVLPEKNKLRLPKNGGGRSVLIEACRHGGGEFESFQRRSTSPFSSAPLAALALLKILNIAIQLLKKVRGKRSYKNTGAESWSNIPIN